MTLLHVLIQSHSAEIARAAVQAGALVDAGGARTAAAATPVGSPLHAAVQRGSLQHVQVLLDVGASLSLVDSAGDTPLHLAARANDAGMVAALASHGAPTHATDRMQGTPLHAAASAGGHEACDALLECGADAAALDDVRASEVHCRRPPRLHCQPASPLLTHRGNARPSKSSLLPHATERPS